jgi:predicted Zn finger-like uncharacterized protein
MSLATRCTECGTVFRVVEDQLKVSEGWVRCGRCSAVFNAQAELFDLDAPRASAPAGPLPQAPQAGPVTDSAAPARPEPYREVDADDWSPQMPAAPDAEPEEDLHHPAFAITAPAAQTVHPQPDAGLFAGPEPLDEGDESALVAPAGDAPAALVAPADGSPDTIVSIGDTATMLDGPPVQIDADETTPTPSFMRTDESGSFWNRPGVRRALTAGSALLLLALVLQSVVIWRDSVAAHVPALRPALTALCSGLGCRITPLRRIERLAVESSGLTRIEGAPLHRFAITLRNRADTQVLAPAIDLSVTDAQGKLVARRVLQLSDLGANATTLEAGAEMPLQALLNTGDRRVSGYAVELFYP